MVTSNSLKYLDVSTLKPNVQNPRRHTAAQVRAIARSIEAFGFNAPIFVDRNGTIVAGHGRYAAAKFLKLAQVPVISLDALTPEQAKAYMLADNKLTDRSNWDEALLGQALKNLQELSLDFELEATGFQTAEIDLAIQAVTPGFEEEDEIPEVSRESVTTRIGDLWHLGEHRLFCGSALERSSYDVLLEGRQYHTLGRRYCDEYFPSPDSRWPHYCLRVRSDAGYICVGRKGAERYPSAFVSGVSAGHGCGIGRLWRPICSGSCHGPRDGRGKWCFRARW